MGEFCLPFGRQPGQIILKHRQPRSIRRRPDDANIAQWQLTTRIRQRQYFSLVKDPSLDQRQAAAAEQFDRQSDRYGKSHILANTADIEGGLAGLKPGPGATALDVATGGGHAAVFLAGRGWQVTAGDIAPRMLANASRLADDAGVQIETRLFPAEQMPFAASTFDLVTSRVAPHHFSDPGLFIAEVTRVLKPGGHFLLIDGSVPDADPMTEAWLHAVEKWRDPSHGRFLSREAWVTLVRSHGLTVLSAELNPRKQPDLNWYFDTAATSLENRARVLEAVRTAPDSVRTALRLGAEDDRIVWWWPMLTLLTRKAG
jgi:ubiquinone/menaquinone biosynthesis C-methylase UbiE